MSSRLLLALGVALLAAALGLVALLGGDAPAPGAGGDQPTAAADRPVGDVPRAPAGDGPRAPVGEGASGAPIAPSPRSAVPRLPAKTQPLPTTSAGDEPLWRRYDDEVRAPGWAIERERAIRQTLRPLLDEANRGRAGAVTVPAVECRERSCRLLVIGEDEAAFMQLVEALQGERGFYGDAALLALDGYGELVDKQTGAVRKQLRVHLTWDR